MPKLYDLDLTRRASAGVTFVPTYPITDPATGEPRVMLGPDGEPATITVLGKDSEKATWLSFEQQAAVWNKRQAKILSGGSEEQVVAAFLAEQRVREIELLVAVTVAWTGFLDDDDQPAPCTPENLRTLYTGTAYVREQAIREVNDRSAFFDHLSTPSPAPSNTDSD